MITTSQLAVLQSPKEDQLRNLFSLFLAGKSPGTLKAYSRDINSFSEYIGAKSPQEGVSSFLSQAPGDAMLMVLTYQAHLNESGLATSTINRSIAALRSLVKLARAVGLVNWTLEVKGLPNVPYRDTRGPGIDAVRRMFNHLSKSEKPINIRNVAIIRLLFDLGLRRGEVVSLDIEHLDINALRLSVLGKGRREREYLSIPEPTALALTNWLTFRGDEPGPLFLNFDRAGKGQRLTGTSIFRIVRKVGKEIGVKLRPHSLRHTSITEACKIAQSNGMTLEEVMDFSRHKDIRTLMIYRDRIKNVQGYLASRLVTTSMEDNTTNTI